VYGWTTNPLVEYYVVEDYNQAPSGNSVGTVTSDGGTYNIYTDTRTNEPSIEGTSTFLQIKSVRTSPRSSGTVTTANHFAAWKSKGLTLGTYNLQVLATEGYNKASGSVSQTLSYA
jgi:endo-1,4-beta-xylanase